MLPIMVLVGIAGTAAIWSIGVAGSEFAVQLTVLLIIAVPLLTAAMVEIFRFYKSHRRSPSKPFYGIAIVGFCYGATLGPFYFSALRCVSVHLLAVIGPAGIPGLSQALLFDPSQSVFDAAASHLEQAGGADAAEALGECLAKRRGDDFEFPVTRALFRMGPEGVRVLDRRLRYVESGVDYSAGEKAWRDMMIVRVVPEFPRESEGLIPALRDLAMDNTASRENRVDTVVALGSIGPPSADALESLANLPSEGAEYGRERNTDLDVREAAAKALVNLASE